MSIRRRFSAGVAATTAVLTGAIALTAATWRAADDVEVVLLDGEIQMADSAYAGQTVFQIRNDGQMEHSFAVRTAGDEPLDLAALEASVAPGETATLEVELEPGTYQVLCPLQDHQDRGMSLQLVVVEKPMTP
jgi:uncharacterized cupredoxin-like copper-binding protein